MTVAMSEALKATRSELPRAATSLPVTKLASPLPTAKMFPYHRVVNPRHTETEGESLNENTMSTTMGAHKKK